MRDEIRMKGLWLGVVHRRKWKAMALELEELLRRRLYTLEEVRILNQEGPYHVRGKEYYLIGQGRGMDGSQEISVISGSKFRIGTGSEKCSKHDVLREFDRGYSATSKVKTPRMLSREEASKLIKIAEQPSLFNALLPKLPNLPKEVQKDFFEGKYGSNVAREPKEVYETPEEALIDIDKYLVKVGYEFA